MAQCAALQEEGSDTKNAPHFYMLHSQNCSESEAGQRKALLLTLLPQSPPWVQRELSGKATNVQGA